VKQLTFPEAVELKHIALALHFWTQQRAALIGLDFVFQTLILSRGPSQAPLIPAACWSKDRQSISLSAAQQSSASFLRRDSGAPNTSCQSLNTCFAGMHFDIAVEKPGDKSRTPNSMCK
jgi:hypothetical protein